MCVSKQAFPPLKPNAWLVPSPPQLTHVWNISADISSKSWKSCADFRWRECRSSDCSGASPPTFSNASWYAYFVFNNEKDELTEKTTAMLTRNARKTDTDGKILLSQLRCFNLYNFDTKSFSFFLSFSRNIARFPPAFHVYERVNDTCSGKKHLNPFIFPRQRGGQFNWFDAVCFPSFLSQCCKKKRDRTESSGQLEHPLHNCTWHGHIWHKTTKQTK